MDLIRDMLNRASGLLSEGRTIVEWFDPKSYLHRGAFQIYCKTGSWPEGIIPENVTLTPGFCSSIARKIFEAWSPSNPASKIPEWAQEAFERAMQGYSGEFEGEFGVAEILDFVRGQCPSEAEWTPELRSQLVSLAKQYGLNEGHSTNYDLQVGDTVVVLRGSSKGSKGKIVDIAAPGEDKYAPEGQIDVDVPGRGEIHLDWDDVKREGATEGKVPDKDDSDSKIIQKLTEAGIKENEVRDIWVVIRPQSDKATMDDVVAKSTPRRLMIMAKGGLEPEDLVGVYDNDIDARKKGSALLGAGVAEKKVNEGPLDAEKPEDEAGAGLKDPGFKGKKEPGPGEKEEEAPVGDLDVDDEHEAVEADFDKIYLGQDDTNHYYVIAKKDEEGSTEDLLVTDQEGKELFSAKENGVDVHDVGKFILAAINSDKVKIRELEREVVIQYLVPEKEEELGAGEEEEEEGEGSEGEETTPKTENEPPETENPDQERPMESRKVVTEKKVTETVTMKDGKGNTFSLQVVDEGGKDVVVQINNREFRFKPDFVSLYEMDGGKLTEKGLQDMATELISHLREDEYAEVVGSGVQEDLDPSVTKGVGEDTLLQRAQQLRAKKDRTPDDDATLQQLENELKTRGQKAAEGKVPSKDDSDAEMVKKLTEQYLDESEEFQSCASHGGRVRTVSGPDKEHGLKAGEYVHYCYLGNKSYRGEVKTKKNESAVEEKKNPKAKTRNRGDVVFPAGSSKVKDEKDYFPVNTEKEAHAALSYVQHYTSVPPWYKGSLADLKKKVIGAVHSRFPKIKIESLKNEGKEPGRDDSLEKIIQKLVEMEEDGLAKKAGKTSGDFDKEQLEAGTKVEMEHTNDQSKARQIAMDHLTEDPQYYIKLKKMESESKMNEREHSDLALQADTKGVFKVDFVLDSGEKRSTKVMAIDKFDAEKMLKRQKGVKSVASVTPVAGARESKVEEDYDESEEEVVDPARLNKARMCGRSDRPEIAGK